jgi:hypothetical protein
MPFSRAAHHPTANRGHRGQDRVLSLVRARRSERVKARGRTCGRGRGPLTFGVSLTTFGWPRKSRRLLTSSTGTGRTPAGCISVGSTSSRVPGRLRGWRGDERRHPSRNAGATEMQSGASPAQMVLTDAASSCCPLRDATPWCLVLLPRLGKERRRSKMGTSCTMLPCKCTGRVGANGPRVGGLALNQQALESCS